MSAAGESQRPAIHFSKLLWVVQAGMPVTGPWHVLPFRREAGDSGKQTISVAGLACSLPERCVSCFLFFIFFLSRVAGAATGVSTEAANGISVEHYWP